MAAPQTRKTVPWREVVFFSLIAYGLTWGWDAIWVAPRLGELLAAPTTPRDGTIVFGNLLNHIPAMFGPLLAAVAMRLWVSREGLGGSLGFRQPWRYYAVALAAPATLIAVVGVIILLTELGIFQLPSEPLTIAIVPLLLVLIIPETILAFGEEYGWRGYLLPRLMPLGEIPASLIVGVVWAFWHLPVVVAGVLLGGYSLWLVIPLHLFLVTVASIPYTWLARATGYSPVIAAIFHGSNNWAQQRFVTFILLGNLLVGIAIVGFAWLAVVVVWYAFLWSRPPRTPV